VCLQDNATHPLLVAASHGRLDATKQHLAEVGAGINDVETDKVRLLPVVLCVAVLQIPDSKVPVWS
jgi:hypothetical protein